MDERIQRISLRAYEIWEQGGRRDDRHFEDWLEAEREIDAAPAIAETSELPSDEVASPAERPTPKRRRPNGEDATAAS